MAKTDDSPTTPDSAAPITLDKKFILEIAAAVALAMKGQGGQQFSMEELGKTIGDSVAAGIAQTTRRKVTFGEYQMTGHSSFHPKPATETPKLKRTAWQNGVWMNPATLFDEEVVLLNTITHSGRYIDRLVEVSLRNEGMSNEEVFISFPNKDINDQLTMKGHFKDFVNCLRLIKLAQDEERADRAEQEEAKRQKPRQAFAGKATMEARAAAGVV